MTGFGGGKGGGFCLFGGNSGTLEAGANGRGGAVVVIGVVVVGVVGLVVGLWGRGIPFFKKDLMAWVDVVSRLDLGSTAADTLLAGCSAPNGIEEMLHSF